MSVWRGVAGGELSSPSYVTSFDDIPTGPNG
jgi:hypothetical protein